MENQKRVENILKKLVEQELKNGIFVEFAIEELWNTVIWPAICILSALGILAIIIIISLIWNHGEFFKSSQDKNEENLSKIEDATEEN